MEEYSALQNKDEEPLHLLSYFLLNQNDPLRIVAIQALLNPGSYPDLFFWQISNYIFNFPTTFEIDPQ